MRHSRLSDIAYFVFKTYLRYVHEEIFIARRYTIGYENIPARGERFFVICNHQNAAEDPINIMFSLPFWRRLGAMARADLFTVHPLVTRFLRFLGMVPAFRFGWEGGDGLEQNTRSFDIVSTHVNDQYPLIVFPEAGHTQGHYMQRFTTGTVRMAFYTAEANGWKEDVKILPTAHHYSDYFGLRSDFVLTICPPISLKPYYEEYQQHPNTVLRKLTHQLHDTVHANMLDEGEPDYAAKDFLRRSAFNPATFKHLDLPDRIHEDQCFVDAIRIRPDYLKIVELASKLEAEESKLGFDEVTLMSNPSLAKVILRALLLLCLSPLFVLSLWPDALCYWLPMRYIRTDRMFTNSLRYLCTVLILYPVIGLISLLIGGLLGYWWQTLIWIILWVPLGRFAWWYWQGLHQCRSQWNALRNGNKIEILRQELKNILK